MAYRNQEAAAQWADVAQILQQDGEWRARWRVFRLGIYK